MAAHGLLIRAHAEKLHSKLQLSLLPPSTIIRCNLLLDIHRHPPGGAGRRLSEYLALSLPLRSNLLSMRTAEFVHGYFSDISYLSFLSLLCDSVLNR